jgi:hypothetical protein
MHLFALIFSDFFVSKHFNAVALISGELEKLLANVNKQGETRLAESFFTSHDAK